MNLDNLEIPDSLTPQEIANACRGFIDDSECDDIASMQDVTDAVGAAYGAFIAADRDPDELLKSLGILE